MKLEDIFQYEHAMAKMLCKKTWLKKKWDIKYGVEKKLKNSICDKTKKSKQVGT